MLHCLLCESTHGSSSVLMDHRVLWAVKHLLLEVCLEVHYLSSCLWQGTKKTNAEVTLKESWGHSYQKKDHVLGKISKPKHFSFRKTIIILFVVFVYYPVTFNNLHFQWGIVTWRITTSLSCNGQELTTPQDNCLGSLKEEISVPSVRLMSQFLEESRIVSEKW